VTFSYNSAGQIVGREATNITYAWTGHGNGSTTYDVDGLNRLTKQTTGPTVTGFRRVAFGVDRLRTNFPSRMPASGPLRFIRFRTNVPPPARSPRESAAEPWRPTPTASGARRFEGSAGRHHAWRPTP
jgi:hypothetical protein